VPHVLTPEMNEILSASKKYGWVLEPDAKRLLSMAGVTVPKYEWVKDLEAAKRAASAIGFPVVGKIVSPKILHKSDCGGVILGIDGERELAAAYDKLKKIEGFDGMLIEETLAGVELIVGAKNDFQFGPILLLGMGGTGVEIYNDASIRMAPIDAADVSSMIGGLKARRIIEGYRGSSPVRLEELTRLLLVFSDLAMAFEDFLDSIDLNPVMCTDAGCVVADARIVFKEEDK